MPDNSQLRCLGRLAPPQRREAATGANGVREGVSAGRIDLSRKRQAVIGEKMESMDRLTDPWNWPAGIGAVMSLLDTSGMLGQVLKLHDYYVKVENPRILNHSHPGYSFLVLHLMAQERVTPVTRKLGNFRLNPRGWGMLCKPILLEGWGGHCFDPDVLFRHYSNVEQGDVIFEILRKCRRYSFELAESGIGDSFESFDRHAKWKIDLDM